MRVTRPSPGAHSLIATVTIRSLLIPKGLFERGETQNARAYVRLLPTPKWLNILDDSEACSMPVPSRRCGGAQESEIRIGLIVPVSIFFTHFLITFLPSFPTSPCLTSGIRETTNTFDWVRKSSRSRLSWVMRSMSDLQWDATSLAESRIGYCALFLFPLLSSYSS